MKLTINGAISDYPASSTITQLLERLKMQNKRIALEINNQIISKSQYDDFSLTEGDKIEIIQAIGGG